VVLLALAAGACSSVGDEAAATVEGADVSQAEVEGELEAISSNEDYLLGVEQQFQAPSRGEGEGTYDASFVARLLSLRVYYELVEQELERRGPGDLRRVPRVVPGPPRAPAGPAGRHRGRLQR